MKNNSEKSSKAELLSRIFSNKMIIPIIALLILVVVNLIKDPSFFSVSFGENSDGNPVMSGNMISVIDFGTELAILAIGMTLVTAATGGQDISVGAAMAISASVVFRVLCGANAQYGTPQNPIILAFVISAVVAMLFGAFNGVLVAFFKIQPMVATLILFTAGRSIAAWINNNRLPNLNDSTFKIAGTFIPGIPIPTSIFIATACMIITGLVLKFTNLGLYAQTVGINENSARLNGINPKLIKMITFIILGLCVSISAFVKASRTGTLNYSGFALDIEMDAILAVALGGNSLSGGKFNMASSIIGAYVIQFLTTTLYSFKISSAALSAYKAIVVIILVVLSAPVVKDKLVYLFDLVKRKLSKNVQEVE